MKRRHDEERVNDVTATECCACGAEGHTRQSGGQIEAVKCSDGRTVEVCETCCEDFHRYGGVFADEVGDEIGGGEFDRLLVLVNAERAERGAVKGGAL